MLFSLGGVHFNGGPVTYVPMTDVTLEHARNLTIPLEDRAARFLKLCLYFRSNWIVLGEAYFFSGESQFICVAVLVWDSQPHESSIRVSQSLMHQSKCQSCL